VSEYVTDSDTPPVLAFDVTDAAVAGGAAPTKIAAAANVTAPTAPDNFRSNPISLSSAAPQMGQIGQVG
jgi:hypothetical protein